MFNFPENNMPKNNIERREYKKREQQKRDIFQQRIAYEIYNISRIPTAEKLPLDVFPISQKKSKYSELKYGEIGTVGNAGCGPLAVEYALRLTGHQTDFEEILNECIAKGYRDYIYDDNNNIIDGNGTTYSLFDNLAIECVNLKEIFYFVKKGFPITLLIQNSIYKNDKKAEGNHFITLVGIDKEKNALLMDGNKIEDESNPSEALVKMAFYDIALAIKGAWAWEK